jgi:hypothetical protein
MNDHDPGIIIKDVLHMFEIIWIIGGDGNVF